MTVHNTLFKFHPLFRFLLIFRFIITSLQSIPAIPAVSLGTVGDFQFCSCKHNNLSDYIDLIINNNESEIFHTKRPNIDHGEFPTVNFDLFFLSHFLHYLTPAGLLQYSLSLSSLHCMLDTDFDRLFDFRMRFYTKN